MNPSRPFDEILDQRLGDLRAGHTTLDACLRAHPDSAAELAPLLEMALALADAGDVQPAPAFVRATRA